MNPWIFVGLSHNDRYAAVRYYKTKDTDKPDTIAIAVAEAFDVTVEELRGKSRYQTIADARHSMIKMTRQELGYSTPQIGKYLGRHHATILNSLKVFDQIFEYDKTFAKRHQRAEQIYLETIKQINEKAAALRGVEDSTH